MSTAERTRQPRTQSVADVTKSALEGHSVHPAADMFPVIDEAQLKALADDIAKHGQQEPIWMYQGQLLDGRNRVIACAIIGKTPVRQEWNPKPGETPSTFVMSRNVHRRHLSASQRAALAAELEAVIAEENRQLKNSPPATGTSVFSHKQQAPVTLAPRNGSTQLAYTKGAEVVKPRTGEKVKTGRARDKAASTMHVSTGYVNDAKDLKQAAPEKFDKVKSGELTISRAQDEVVAEAQAEGTLDAVKLRPGAVRAAMQRLEAENKPKRPEAPAPIRLPKASKVESSATSLSITVTFGNPKVAEEWLNRMQEDKRVLELNYEVVEKKKSAKSRRRYSV